jgi:hypothetical protein
MAIRFPWDSDAAAVASHNLPPEPEERPTKRRGRRPRAGAGRARSTAATPEARWLYHHLTIAGPADAVAAFAAAACGAGVTPWRLDFAMLEEDLFNLAASQPAAGCNLTIAGCRILARQFRERVEQRQGRAIALVGHGRSCPFDLHALHRCRIPFCNLA